MASFFTRLAALLGALSFIHTTVSAPLEGSQFEKLDVGAREILARSTPAAPRFVVYSDAWISGETGPPAVADVAVSHAYDTWRISPMLIHI
jgi:chitinase